MSTKPQVSSLTFAQWLAKMNDIVSSRIGLNSDDLEDFCVYDCWESGASPREGADECMENDTVYSGWNDE